MQRRNFLLLALAVGIAPMPAMAETALLNVSYDPTREFYAELNRSFAADWKSKSGKAIAIRTSNGGSGAQALAVINGLQADVVTLAVASDIDALADHGLLARDWMTRLPNDSTPYTSTIVFLVRKGNPKAIHDWPDLIKPGVSVITPNPKTSGGARWNYLAAYAWALRQPGGTEAVAEDYLRKLLHNVPVLDSGSRGATNTFVQRGLGDVLLAWENEALLAGNELGRGQFDIVYPSLSILAEPPVAVVDAVVDQRGTRAVAEAYLQYLYSAHGQTLAAKHFFRPRNAGAAAQYMEQFPAVKMITISDLGGWAKVQKEQFADGGVFDRIYTPGQ
jgi:sulfate/thiosulfate transport system substrate-binding protein